VMRVLRGDGNQAATAAVVLNGAAALYVGGACQTFDEGVSAAQEAIRAGAGLVALERLRGAFKRPDVA
jgi:anthranilate phosphoribosyltransferase